MTKQRIARHALLAMGLGLAMTVIAGADSGGRKDKEAPPLASSAYRTLPNSSFLTPETVRRLQVWKELWKESPKEIETCGEVEGSNTPAEAKHIDLCHAEFFYQHPLYQDIRNRYQVSISTQEIGGVPAEVFTPRAGVAPQNKHRVLINLHAGAFRSGSRTVSHLESIPISAVARIKVISVDYRMAPQFYFPAASEDVAAVYTQLLKEYDSASIGIYGCSAGGLLTAQSVAWLQKGNLPMPGAVGMFCGAANYWSEGDSGNFATMWEERPKTIAEDPNFEYLKHESLGNPLVYPARSKEIVAGFPPALLITSTRDLALSSVVYMHSLLIQQGVPAELHVWEGLPHAFFLDPELPQSRDMYEVTARFFERYLGKTSAKDRLSRQ